MNYEEAEKAVPAPDIERTVREVTGALSHCGVHLRRALDRMDLLKRELKELKPAAEDAADCALIDESEREGGEPIPWEKLRDEGDAP